MIRVLSSLKASVVGRGRRWRAQKRLFIEGLEGFAKIIDFTDHRDELAHRAPFVGRLLHGGNNYHERSPASCQGSVLIPDSRCRKFSDNASSPKTVAIDR